MDLVGPGALLGQFIIAPLIECPMPGCPDPESGLPTELGICRLACAAIGECCAECCPIPLLRPPKQHTSHIRQRGSFKEMYS